MAKPHKIDPTPSPAEPEPERSAKGDEHEGLALRLLELRATVEEHRKTAVRENGELKATVARFMERVDGLQQRFDDAMGELARRERLLEQAQRDGGEHVRRAGEIAQKMEARVKVLGELRELATDPHEVVKPVRRDVAVLRQDLEALKRNVDHKLESLPARRAAPLESRDEVGELRVEVRQLRKAVEGRSA